MDIREEMFIGGEWRKSSDGKVFDVLNPADNSIIAKVQKAGKKDIEAAIEAADVAFKEWGTMNPANRSALLHKVGDAITANAAFLAQVESDDVGKPIFESANIDIASAAATFHYFADISVEILGDLRPSPYNEVFDYTIREPIGIVGAIIPWNFPFLIAARKIASALAAGNTMVLKPATWAPLSTLLYGELFTEAGVSDGVLNIVPASGPDVGDVFSESKILEEISFTGSTEIGTSLYRSCAGGLKNCTLELGGKSPGLVMPDCNMAETVAGTLFGVFLNQGECCCGLTRLIVHEKVYEEFVGAFVGGARKISMGMPRVEATKMGPLIHPDHLNSVMKYVESAKDEGAEILCGGEKIVRGELSSGNFMEPTVIANVTPNMRVWKEEIFGPVVVISKASDIEDMIDQANDSSYGLAASVWTTNLKTAHTMAPRIKAGTVWFNLHNFVFPSAPYGGVGKSGVGSELGKEGVLALTRTKNVMISLFPDGFAWY
jgi:acyl-CoA reductase-like NAD-dependent aldehyde dehydrogenase